MNREQVKEYISNEYNADAQYPWAKYPNYAVYRHKNNKKWFALIMDIPKNKLGLESSQIIDVLNVKCDPIMIGSLLNTEGFYPAYHMNKENWITIALDASDDDDNIKFLIDRSFELTFSKK